MSHSRRKVLQVSLAATLASMTARAFGDEGDEVVPFLDPQAYDPKRPMLNWDELRPTDWITPTERVYEVSHYKPIPKIDGAAHKIELHGLVEKPATFTLEELRKRPSVELTATLECGGNGASPSFRGAIANVKWSGTPLAPILREAGISPAAIEVAFWGADKGKEKIRGGEYEQNFARCLSIPMATREDVILCYEMNGKPLPAEHGFPVRLVVPGWYGIAWVKWIERIELRDRALKTRFMAKDYVTLRGREVNGKTVWEESLVGPMNVKSAVARVSKEKGGLKVSGAAWSEHPIKTVEVSIDGGAWQAAKILEGPDAPYTWRFWALDWKDAKSGEHTIVSRATDVKGNVQPTAEDPLIKNKKTYWEANAQWPRKVKVG